MTCLSRRDSDKDIFDSGTQKKPKTKRRWNFYSLIDIKGGNLTCQNEDETYSIDELCHQFTEDNQKCTLDGTTVDLNPTSGVDLCHDYSFWQKSTGRCSSSEDELGFIGTFPTLCHQETTDCLESWSNDFSFCRDTANKSICSSLEGTFFCQSSKTCILEGKE